MGRAAEADGGRIARTLTDFVMDRRESERWADAQPLLPSRRAEASFTRGAVERVPPTFSSLMRLVGIRPGKSPTASVGLCPVHGLHKANVLFQASNPLY